ncbi:MAG: GNAT family N-acetyltransferase [Saprospiraceae bacterium]
MITYQTAPPSDLVAIAELHARSWQQNNRGILDDNYLDNLVQAERLKVWTERFTNPVNNQHIITTKDNGKLCGFTCLFGEKQSKYGVYLDNLHISKDYQGKGIGRQLMNMAGQWVAKNYPNQGMHLLVFVANTPAIGFYQKLGGQEVEIGDYDLGDGTGRVGATARYYWENPGELI